MARILIALPLLACSLVAPAHAGATRGAELFEENCADCHSLAKPLTNRKGPGLTGIVDRKAAAVPDFRYSAALRTANFTWTAERLDEYLRAPKRLVPGNKMKFDGMPDAEERRQLIDFLAQH
jgi:cytochrome c